MSGHTPNPAGGGIEAEDILRRHGVGEDGGPAFPQLAIVDSQTGGKLFVTKDGMSLREYAAIKLRVPMSDCSWLDEMIREALRDWFAGMALQGILAGVMDKTSFQIKWDMAAQGAYYAADAMLKARGQ